VRVRRTVRQLQVRCVVPVVVEYAFRRSPRGFAQVGEYEVECVALAVRSSPSSRTAIESRNRRRHVGDQSGRALASAAEPRLSVRSSYAAVR